jgi:benzoylformate decarboxylase
LRALTDKAKALRTKQQQTNIDQRVQQWRTEKETASGGVEQMVQGMLDSMPANPIAACAEILAALEPGTAIVDDAVTNTVGVRSMLRSSEPGTYFFTRGGGLGWGIPAALGVKLADPDRPVVAIVGDGTALYAPQALWTMAHHDVPVVTVVLNNRSYHILKSGLKNMAGKAAKHDRWPGMDIVDPPVDFLSLAQSFGVHAEKVEHVRDLRKAVQGALSTKRPALLEIDVEAML